MRITLATSPHIRHPAVLHNDFETRQNAMISFIPVGLLSLISTARKSAGVEPKLFDLNRSIMSGMIPLGSSFYESAAEALCSDSPDLVGFMTESDSYHHVLQMCDAIKRRLPQCLVVLGGPQASAVARPTLKSWKSIDYVVQGEGEITFAGLLQNLMRGDSRPVDGALGRDQDGGAMTAESRAQLTSLGSKERSQGRSQVLSLDSLPPPAYELYQPDPGEEIFLEVGRGCPFRCTFCSTAPFWKRQHRVKSPTRIMSEIQDVLRLYGPRRIHFTHDLLTTDRVWVRLLCDTLRSAGSPVRWTCSSRTDTIDEELLAVMASAGCDAIYFGLESGSERILREIHKDIPIEHSFRILSACREAGITPNAGFIGGLPTEDEESLQETFRAFTRAWRLGCSPAHIFLYTPYADSAVFSSLTETVCTGHFLDLPLDSKLDISNRDLVASDRVLYGAFHRPKHPSIRAELLDALEEFPTLVASAVVPTLAIAERIGGMFRLFETWASWIGRVNRERGAASFREYSGSPVQFCDFLLEAVGQHEDMPIGLDSLLRVLRMNHVTAGAGSIATTLADYRTKLASADIQVMNLGSRLSLGNVLGTLRVDHEISGALAAQPGSDLPVMPLERLHLVWSHGDSGPVRLLRVDEFTFGALEVLRKRSTVAADIIREWVTSPHKDSVTDFGELLTSLGEAAMWGLIAEAEAEQQ